MPRLVGRKDKIVMKTLPKVYVSPYSEDIVNMVCAYKRPIGFICSWSQVNPNEGYTGFTPTSLRGFVGDNVVIAQDHFLKGGESPEQLRGLPYDYVHLHTDNVELIQVCMKAFPDMRWELGTGEDPLPDYKAFIADLAESIDFTNVEYLSFPTGCKINGCHNINKPDIDLCEWMCQFRTPLKGHNSDYINYNTLVTLSRYIDAWNIAPQLGVIATRVYVTYARTYGHDISAWEEAVINGGRWKRWGDMAHAIELGGQYHLNDLPKDVRIDAYPFVKVAIYRLFDFLFEVIA